MPRFSQIALLPPNSSTYFGKCLSSSSTYYYRVAATDSGGDSDSSSVVSATTMNAPLFSETWDQVTGPIQPSAYLAHTSGTVSGADNTWTYATETSSVLSCGFRTNPYGLEVGRFAAGASTGDFDLAASLITPKKLHISEEAAP